MNDDAHDVRARVAENPFYVLGLTPQASRIEVEREGQKLLGMLELGLGTAATYATPLGTFPRTPELVRQAMAELRDPQKRLTHELWAVLSAEPRSSGDERGDEADGDHGWPEAMAIAGWGRRP